MNKFRFTIKLVVIATFLFAFASVAQAQATRTWVSGVGDDVNPCSRTAPCKTYAGAISKTAANGEISTLDPGGFGAVTITKNLTIDGTTGAGFGSILASGTSGVIINAAGINVILRNLSINGAFTTAGSGIRFLNGRSLTVENCEIFAFTGTGTVGRGISVELAVTGAMINVSNTRITQCTTGIRLGTSSGLATGTFDNVKILLPTTTAGTGVAVETGGFATLRDSTIANYSTGVNLTGSAGAVLLRTTVFNAAVNGVNVGAATLRASASSIIFNTTGVTLGGGSFFSGCDNFLNGNTTKVAGGAIQNACVE